MPTATIFRTDPRERRYCELHAARRLAVSPGGMSYRTILLPAPPADCPDCVCTHPPRRLYSWYVVDGVLCVGCCECGGCLAGAA